jgi:hypothetical protein
MPAPASRSSAATYGSIRSRRRRGRPRFSSGGHPSSHARTSRGPRWRSPQPDQRARRGRCAPVRRPALQLRRLAALQDLDRRGHRRPAGGRRSSARPGRQACRASTVPGGNYRPGTPREGWGPRHRVDAPHPRRRLAPGPEGCPSSPWSASTQRWSSSPMSPASCATGPKSRPAALAASSAPPSRARWPPHASRVLLLARTGGGTP